MSALGWVTVIVRSSLTYFFKSLEYNKHFRKEIHCYLEIVKVYI
jgi:hypothetical protein